MAFFGFWLKEKKVGKYEQKIYATTPHPAPPLSAQHSDFTVDLADGYHGTTRQRADHVSGLDKDIKFAICRIFKRGYGTEALFHAWFDSPPESTTSRSIGALSNSCECASWISGFGPEFSFRCITSYNTMVCFYRRCTVTVTAQYVKPKSEVMGLVFTLSPCAKLLTLCAWIGFSHSPVGRKWKSKYVALQHAWPHGRGWNKHRDVFVISRSLMYLRLV